MIYERDESKRQTNQRKHRVDFAIVDAFEWENSVSHEDDSARYGEVRVVSVGPIGPNLYVLVWTEPDDDVVRVISLRPADKRERKLHEKGFQKKTHH